MPCRNILKPPSISSFFGWRPIAFTARTEFGFYSWSLGKTDLVRVGLTDYLQQRNGDVAFVHPKAPGTKLAAGDDFAEMETIKATLDLLSPIAGEIVEVNSALETTPEIINQDPYGKGWVAVIKAENWEIDRTKLLEPQAILLAHAVAGGRGA